MKPPCTKDCPDRTVGCHATCEKYLKFREEHEKFYAERLNDRKLSFYLADSIRRCAHKNPVIVKKKGRK